MHYLLSAVKLVTNLIKWLVQVHLEEAVKGHSFLPSLVLLDFVPQNIGFVLAIEPYVMSTLGDPVMALKDYRWWCSLVQIKARKLLICTDLEAFLSFIRSTVTDVLEFALVCHRTKLVAIRAYSCIDVFAAND